MPPSAEYSLSMPIRISTGYGTGAAKHMGNKYPFNMKHHSSLNSRLDIIDIRRVAVETNLKAEILSMFGAKDGPRRLPTLLLYDEKGLQLFERVSLSPGTFPLTRLSNSF